MTLEHGILLTIILYGVGIYVLAKLWVRTDIHSKRHFLLGNRKIGKWEGAFSIASTWIWAPALFVSSELAYTLGFAGVFWFVVPNVLCLILFSYFAHKIRYKFPTGYTLSGYMRERHSQRVQILYIIQLLVLSTCSFTVQLLAGGSVIATMTGTNFFTVTVLLSLITLSYTLRGGLRGSTVTDYVQMVLILVVGVSILPWIVNVAGGTETLTRGLGGITGQYHNLFSAEGWHVFLTFGLASTIGLFSGPFGDQAFWQRAWGIQQDKVKQAFLWGALIFALVPISLSILGFVMAGAQVGTDNTQLINLQAVQHFLPEWVIIPFVIMLLSGLISTLNTSLSAVSSIAGHDIYSGMLRKHSGYKIARNYMILITIVAVFLANIPSITILFLFLFYGTFRSTTMLPTIITILKKQVSEKGVFIGIVASLLIGLPIFSYGNIHGYPVYIVMGSLLSVSLSGILTLWFSRKRPQEPQKPRKVRWER